MDFDEYEYLEKSVEDPEARRGKEERRASQRHREGEGEDDGEGRGATRSARRNKDEEEHGRRRDRGDGRERPSRPERRERDQYRDGKHAERENDVGKDRRGGDREHRERDGEKEKGLEREGGRERERSRRSSSRSRRHERDEVERERARSRERAAREKEMERATREKEMERELRERESRKVKEKKEPEEVDPERDLRTVFAYQMPLKATERDVYDFFSKADVRLIMDRNSRRSKGVGYIEFYDVMSVPNAIAISGQLLLGQPVMVKPSEAEKNLVQSNATGGTALARKLYVGNLHFNMSEELLRQVFEPFGPVELVQLPLDLETGQCKGFGFVQFVQLEHAKAAQSLNGKLEIAGRIIKVSAVTDHVGVQDSGANAADFDDDDGGGLSLNAQARAMLMQKLDRTGTASSIAGSLGAPLPNGGANNTHAFGLTMNGQAVLPSALPTLTTPSLIEPVGEPSECVLLKNMFDPSAETDPEFDLDIKEEVQEECSKFGPVKHIYVDKYSKGHVYLQFSTVAAAANCQKAMHLRWFARRSISATYMRPNEYEAKFKSSA